MEIYRGFEILPLMYSSDYFWCGLDYDGAPIDYDTPTDSPHGTGTMQECKDAIDELLAEFAMDICFEACGIAHPEYMKFYGLAA